GDFIYFDPPYHPISKNSFTKYISNGFSEKDQIRLRDFVLELSKNGVNVMLSNSDADFISNIYKKNFEIIKISAPRAGELGVQLEGFVEELIKDAGYEFVTKSKFIVASNALSQKLYTKQFQICESIYSTLDNSHYCQADFLIFNPKDKEKYIIIECKSQTSPGSVDEKYPYLNENIKAKYPYKTIIRCSSG
ncbi:site-specific DNA methylase, partial [Reticulomyxa filosa]